MASEFDALMQQADDVLFRTFGEAGGCTYTAPGGAAAPVAVEVIVNRNAQVAGADGLFYTVQFLAELRLHQISPKRDGLLSLPDGRYRLEKPVDSDGLVERWSLLPVR